MDFEQIINAMNEALQAVDKMPDTALKLSLICTLFDHVCETCGRDKEKTINELRDLILSVQEDLGGMYEGAHKRGEY